MYLSEFPSRAYSSLLYLFLLKVSLAENALSCKSNNPLHHAIVTEVQRAAAAVALQSAEASRQRSV